MQGSIPCRPHSLPYGGASFFRGEREAADLSLFFRAAERQATIFVMCSEQRQLDHGFGWRMKAKRPWAAFFTA